MRNAAYGRQATVDNQSHGAFDWNMQDTGFLIQPHLAVEDLLFPTPFSRKTVLSFLSIRSPGMSHNRPDAYASWGACVIQSLNRRMT